MTVITSLSARKILDSRSEETIEVVVKLGNGTEVCASVPQGKSKSSFEAVYASPDKAIHSVENIIAPVLAGKKPDRQKEIDDILLEIDGTSNKSKLGANAVLGVSLACARAAAAEHNMPLWQYLRELYNKPVAPDHKPNFFINVIEGGVHAKNNLIFQEYLAIPKSGTMQEALNIGKSIWQRLKEQFEDKTVPLGDEGGFTPGFTNHLEPLEAIQKAISKIDTTGTITVVLGLDAAANSIDLSATTLHSLYLQMKKKYNLWYLEDPFPENDFERFASLRIELGDNIIISGDDLTATNPARMQQAHSLESINGIIIKPNQIGTLSETLRAIEKAREWKWSVIISHRSGETNDDFIADLAYAVGAEGIKLGAPVQKERLAKYERLLSIEKYEV
jgi:enolase